MEATSRRLDAKACLEEFYCCGAFNILSSAIDKVISAIYNEKNKINSCLKTLLIKIQVQGAKDFLVLTLMV